jgi:DNA-binding transcriptional ArsR family regulator
MPRRPVDPDAFTAIADPRRRDILVYLAGRERPVGDIVGALRIRQPSVSKHLKVLREAGLVRQRREGRRMMYRTDSRRIRQVHEWTGIFERYWRHQLMRVKERAEERAGRRTEAPGPRRRPGSKAGRQESANEGGSRDDE